MSLQVCEMSEQIFNPGSSGATPADRLPQLPLSSLSEGTPLTIMLHISEAQSDTIKINFYSIKWKKLINNVCQFGGHAFCSLM